MKFETKFKIFNSKTPELSEMNIVKIQCVYSFHIVAYYGSAGTNR